MNQRTSHPVAEVFPLLDGEGFKRLVVDISANGLLEPITLHPDGSILDGRNRYRACIQASVEPAFIKWDGVGDAIAFVISKNLTRRHLNESQRGMIAAKLATLKKGDVASQRIRNMKENYGVGIPTPQLTGQQAADLLNISRETVQDAKAVIKDGTNGEIAAVEQGVAGVSTTARKIRARQPVVGPPTDTAPAKKKLTPGKKKNIQNAALWRQLRDGLEAINGLPDPLEMVKIVPPSQREFVARRLPVVSDWIQLFDLAWKEGNES